MTATNQHDQFDSLLEGIQIIGPDWTYRYVNEVVTEHARFPKDKLLGKRMYDIYPGIEHSELFKLLEDCMAHRLSARWESYFTYEDGSKRWFDLFISPYEEGLRILSLDITDYKRFEETINIQSKRFQALIEKGVDMKTLSIQSGRIIYASPTIYKKLGMDVEGKIIFDLIHPEDLALFQNNREMLLSTPSDTFSFEIRVKCHDGSYIWCEGTSTNLLHEPGVNAIVSNFIDISEKKRVENQQEFDKNNLDALINNCNDAMWSVDREFNLITANNTFNFWVQTRLGLQINPGDNVLNGAPPMNRRWFERNYQRAFTGEAFTETVFISRPVPQWMEISFHPIWKKNDIAGSACHAHDITRRKNLEQSLNKTIKELTDYQYALDTSSIVAITDHQGIITHVNENFCAISGYSREELLGNDHRIINSGHHPKGFFRNLWKTISRGQTWRGEILNRSKAGFLYWVDTTIIPFLDEKQRPYQYIAIRNDITARKQAEDELIRNIEELKKSNFELDRFAYSVSHDLRSPLTSILGLTSFIEEESKEPETLEHAKMIKNGIHRLDQYIKNILSYTRNNRSEIELTPICMADKIREVAEQTVNAKHARDVSFEIEVDEPVEFYSDEQSISVVLQNLISNAIKFQKHANDKLVRITSVTDQDYLRLTIEDNGIGISEEHVERIFDMFFRISGKIEGSGIGLYITREILNRLKGTIEVESTPGNGTRFYVTIKNLRP